MHPSDNRKTAFITNTVNYCNNVMPFGLKNVWATYQRLMNQILREQIGKNVEVYVDDIVMMSDDLKQHLNDLAKVFSQLNKYQMRLNQKSAYSSLGVASFSASSCLPEVSKPTPRSVKPS